MRTLVAYYPSAQIGYVYHARVDAPRVRSYQPIKHHGIGTAVKYKIQYEDEE
jgi:hypothetical protein